MRRRIAGLTVLATFAAASPAVAAHQPTAKEGRAITAAVRTLLVKDKSPAAKTAVINGIQISDHNPNWAVADVSAPEADDAVVALRKRHGRWTALNLGTAQVQCGIGMPKSVMKELFRSTNCAGA